MWPVSARYPRHSSGDKPSPSSENHLGNYDRPYENARILLYCFVTAQVGRLNQVCGPAYTEKRRQIPSNSTTGLIREGLPGHARGVPGQLRKIMIDFQWGISCGDGVS